MMKNILLVIAVLLAGTAQAETDASWWQFWRSADEVTNTSGRLFTEDEKRIIQSYFADHPDYRYDDDNDESGRDKPKKQKSLPPGLQKKLARGGELPPRLAEEGSAWRGAGHAPVQAIQAIAGRTVKSPVNRPG